MSVAPDKATHGSGAGVHSAPALDIYVLLGGGCYRKITVPMVDLLPGAETLSPETLKVLDMGTLYLTQADLNKIPRNTASLRIFFTITRYATAMDDVPPVCDPHEVKINTIAHLQGMADAFVFSYPNHPLVHHIKFFRATGTGYTFKPAHPQCDTTAIIDMALNFIPARYFLARSLMRNDPTQGVELAKKCHEAGYVRATCALGNYYMTELKDIKTALKYLTQAHGLGHCGATLDLADHCLKHGDVRAVNMAQQLVERQHPGGMQILGNLYRAGTLVAKDVAKGMQLLERAAELNYPPAQFTVGMGLLKGTDWPKDPINGMRWLRAAADNNYADAQYEIGIHAFYGRDWPTDIISGLTMLRSACNSGHLGAMHFLANFYLNEQPLPTDSVRGMNLLRVLETRGHAEGSYQLAMALMTGNGMPRDSRRAYDIIQGLAKKGYEPAVECVIAHMKYLSSLWERDPLPSGEGTGEIDASSVLPPPEVPRDLLFTEELVEAEVPPAVVPPAVVPPAVVPPAVVPPAVPPAGVDKRSSSNAHAPRTRQSPSKRR